MTTMNTSVRLSAPFDTALRELGANRSAILRGFMLVGAAEVGAASGLELHTLQADLQQVLRYHLPLPLRRRLEAMQQAMRTPSPRRTREDDAEESFF